MNTTDKKINLQSYLEMLTSRSCIEGCTVTTYYIKTLTFVKMNKLRFKQTYTELSSEK